MALKQLVSNSARRASALLVVVSVIAATLVGMSLRASRADATAAEYFPAVRAASGYFGTGSELNQLSSPLGVAVDAAGNIYVADATNNRIQKWAPGATAGTTVAGGNGEGSNPNQLFYPYGVAVDAAGNIYIGDTGNNRIQKWSPGAAVGTTVAGGNGEGPNPNQLAYPDAVALDGDGNIYIADTENHRIQKWAPSAAAGTTVAGGNELGSNPNQLNSPVGVAVDRFGNIYVADSQNSRIQKWAPGADEGTTVAGGNGYGVATNQLRNPAEVEVDIKGNIYIADTGNNRIQKWVPGAIEGTTVAGGNGMGSAANQLSSPGGVALDGAGTIYIADTGNNRIQKVAVLRATTVAGGNGLGSATNQLRNPGGVALDGAGTIYIADTTNNRIQKWAPNATVGITVAGGNGDGSANNKLSYPNGVAVDAAGNIYIADTNNNRIQKWVPNAIAGTTVAGGISEGDTPELLSYPLGVAVDTAGNIYIADNGNSRVQKWAPGAIVGTTVAGGGGAGANELNSPSGVAVDGDGNIYIADSGNNRIQKWAPGAIVGTTVAGGNGAGSGTNQLLYPSGVAVDGDGNIYIAVPGSSKIQKWAPNAAEGITFAGGNSYGSEINQLNNPNGVAVDGDGNVYVADTYNHRIQKWALAPQAVVLDPISDRAPDSAPFYASALAATALPLTLSSTTQSVCTVIGNVVTLTGDLGECTIRATQAGTVFYAETIAEQSFAVKESQTITFGALNERANTADAFEVSATSSSGLAVAFTSTTPDVCFVEVSTVNLVFLTSTIGTCTIEATQDGNGEYLPATPVEQSFAVKESQTITFGALNDRAFTADSFQVSATSSSGLAVAFTSTTTDVCRVALSDSSTFYMTSIGTCTISATQAGDGTYASATPVEQSFAVKNAQTITFGTIRDRAFTDAGNGFEVTGTSSSGLTVAFDSTTNEVCWVEPSGDDVYMVFLTSKGTCTIRATQAGNNTYFEADAVERSFEVTDAHAMVLRVGDVVIGDGDGPTAKTISVEVSTKGTLAESVCVWWRTADVTATGVDKPTLFNGLQDYMRMGVTKKKFAIIAANKTLSKLSVKLNYDQVIEEDETFQIIVDKVTTQTAGRCVWDANASTDSRIKITRSTGTVTILDDDTAE